MILNDDELQRLEDFLGSDTCGDEALLVDEIHGLLSAVVCSPDHIPAEEWMDLVFDGPPRFANLQQATDIKALLMRLHNEIVRGLNAGEEYLPLFVERITEEGEALLDAEGWCHGFVHGMNLRMDTWMDFVKGGELGRLLHPILTLAADGEGLLGEAAADCDAEAYQELTDLIPTTVEAVFAYWHYGEGLGPERGELCPCGSGEPFDQCCGGRRTLH